MKAPVQSSRIVAIGGAHIDRRGRMTAEFVPGASIPGIISEDVGGGAFNALRVAVRLGAQGTLLSVRGGDGAGLRVAEAIAADDIHDASAVFLDRATPSYTALLDRHGDVVAALADMSLYDMAFPKQMRRAKIRELLSRCDAVLTDANLPQPALQRLLAAAAPLPVFAVAISPAKAIRLGDLLPSLTCLFMNTRECLALAGRDDGDLRAAIGVLSARGLKTAVITSGKRAVVVLDRGRAWSVEPPEAKRVVDVTGAGDALAGATIRQLLGGATLLDAVRHGLAAAYLAVQVSTAVPALDPVELDAALKLVPTPKSVT